MSTLQAVNNDVGMVQEAARLWVPHATTNGSFVTYAGASWPAMPEKPAEVKPPLKPLEWLDSQITEVLELAVP